MQLYRISHTIFEGHRFNILCVGKSNICYLIHLIHNCFLNTMVSLPIGSVAEIDLVIIHATRLPVNNYFQLSGNFLTTLNF